MKSLRHTFAFLHLNKCRQIEELYSKNILKKEAFIISRSYIGKTFHSKISKPIMIPAREEPSRRKWHVLKPNNLDIINTCVWRKH